MATHKKHFPARIITGTRSWKRYSRKARSFKQRTSSARFFLGIGAFALFFALYFSLI